MTAETVRKTCHVLLVDDDPDFLLQQKVMLESAGHTVTTAESAAQGQALAEQQAFDAAVVDLMMEEHDAGFTLCYHLKKHRPDMPVILVTAVTSETGHEFDAATREERSWIKADAWLAKPVRSEQLVGTLDKLLKD